MGTTTTTARTSRTTIKMKTRPFASIESEMDLSFEKSLNCRDEMDTCSEVVKICAAKPTDRLFKIYKPIMEACRKTCGFCDTKKACSSFVEFCDEPGIEETCRGTCRGLSSMVAV